MKVTDHTKAVLANRRAERKARKELTIADLMDEITALRKEVAALKATVDGDHQAGVTAALHRHYNQEMPGNIYGF